MVIIGKYQQTDKNAVMDLIRQNMPEYFVPEETDLSSYSDSERELYYVLLFNNELVG